MKLSTLEYFVTLAESESINKAAQKLYVTQPCLTRAIQGMEKELGVQLFVREKSGIILTKAGEKILPEAKQMVIFYKGWKNLQDMDAVQEITIYSQSVFSHFLLPNVIFQFKKKHPNIIVNLVSTLRPRDFISNDVHHPVVAVTVCSERSIETIPQEQELCASVLLRGEYQCVINHKNPLAQKKNLLFSDLREQFFVFTHIKRLTTGNYGISHMFQNLLDEIPFSNIIEVESIPNMISVLNENTEAFSIAYYPVLKCWNAVSENKLINIPILQQKTAWNAWLLYGRQAYRTHGAVRELVEDIQKAAALLNESKEPNGHETEEVTKD